MIAQNLLIDNIRHMMEENDCSKVSDGDHTFSELYHHRAILTAALFNECVLSAWKSRAHADGNMYDGYFIVGMDTPCGQVTYHYPLEYWNLFHVVELDRATEWDGHTAAVAATRLAMAFCDAPMAQTEEAANDVS